MLGRALAEAVEDDLHCLHVGKLDRLQRFLNFLHAHAVIANFAGAHQIIQDGEGLGPRIEFGRRAVELQQIDGLAGQIAQTVFDPSREILPGVAFHRLTRQAAACFGGNDNLAFV